MRFVTKHLAIYAGYCASLDTRYSFSIGMFARKQPDGEWGGWYPKYWFNWTLGWDWVERYDHPSMGYASSSWTGRNGSWWFSRF